VAPAWSDGVARFRYEPIITGYLRVPGGRLAAPMLSVAEGPQAPAQFAFDHGQLDGEPGLLALVVSGAAPWMEHGAAATREALLRQACSIRGAPPAGSERPEPEMLQQVCEKRATFRCTPGLVRPQAFVSDRIRAAADYVDGPYPATLEGAMRSGLASVEDLPSH
jgi:hydroxysqualene dehydroxylase